VCVCWHGCFIWTSFARVLCVFAPWLRGPFGRCNIDLSKFEREKTHRFWQELEDGAGSLHLLLTISGTTSSETISDLSSYEENPREKANIEARYVSDAAGYLHNNCKNIFYYTFGGKNIKVCQKTFSTHKNIRQDNSLRRKNLLLLWQCVILIYAYAISLPCELLRLIFRFFFTLLIFYRTFHTSYICVVLGRSFPAPSTTWKTSAT